MARRTARTRRETRIAEALQAREPRGVEMAYDEYGRATYGYLLKTIKDRGAAEDVMQQVFLEVWQRGPTYDPERANLFTWIMNMARSRAIDHLRRRVPAPEDPQDPAHEAEDDERPLETMVERWRVIDLLRRLPHEEATLLEMRFYREMSQTEISAATDIPLGTVKTRMVRALERLREMLEEDADAEPAAALAEGAEGPPAPGGLEEDR